MQIDNVIFADGSALQWKCEQPLFAEKYKMIYPLQMSVFTNAQKELESYLGLNMYNIFHTSRNGTKI